eukprot:21691-Chlamydomonas_euryale.AAC.5
MDRGSNKGCVCKGGGQQLGHPCGALPEPSLGCSRKFGGVRCYCAGWQATVQDGRLPHRMVVVR